MAKALRNLTIGTALIGILAGCEDKFSEPTERLPLKGIVREVYVWPQGQEVDFWIDVPRDFGQDNGRLASDTTRVNLREELGNLSPVYPISVGDTIIFVLTSGFSKRDSVEQTGLSSAINHGTFYGISSWPAEGVITGYTKRGN